MRIGINGFEAVIPRFGYDTNGLPNRVGSSEVCFQLLVELEKLDKKNEYIIYLPIEPTSDLPTERKGWSYNVLPNKKFWTIFALSPEIKKEKFDVFFSPTHYGPIFCPFPQVISILDVSYQHFPEMFKKKDLYQLKLWGGYSVKQASKIITISNSSRDDIIKEYKVPSSKVEVVYLGIKGESRIMNQELRKKVLEKYEIKYPYILFVGTLQPRKNIVKLIEAYSKLKDRDVKLVIVGRKGWNFEEIIKAPDEYGVTGSVLFLENVTDVELTEFYKNAELFVLPSLYEGFGLPILEAMKNGCPVAASNISSLPEAGGDAAIYFDPNDAADIAKKIEKVLSDKKLRNDMIKRGHEQVKKFSWEKSARQVLDVLEEVGRTSN